jgi:SPASM domain peptide maturase of grasp-with-spasm system
MYFVLFADLKITHGVKRSCLIDLRSGKLRLLDNRVAGLLSQRIIHRPSQDADTGDLLDHLVELDLGFYCRTLEEVERFPAIPDEFAHAALIMSAIIEIGPKSEDWLETMLAQLAEHGCQHVEIRCLMPGTRERLLWILSACDRNDVPNIALRTNWSSDLTPALLVELCEHPGLNVVDIGCYDVPNDLIDTSTPPTIPGTVVRYDPRPLDSRMCGLVERSKFRANLTFFNESLKHNTCLNRKVSLDQNGHLKHCPSMAQHYGHIKERSLSSVVSDPQFTSVWGVSKEQIDTCKVCEFRNVCVDCRAYRVDPSSEHSKPLKCGYDPHTTYWEPWATDPLAKPAITRYDLIEYLA